MLFDANCLDMSQFAGYNLYEDASSMVDRLVTAFAAIIQKGMRANGQRSPSGENWAAAPE